MKSALARFLDSLFLAVVSWLLAAVITLYFIREAYVVILTATAVTMGTGFFANLKNKKSKQKEEDECGARAAAAHFVFRDDIYALDYFFCALKKRYAAAKSSFFLTVNKTMVVPFVTEPLTLKKAVLFYCEAMRQGAATLVILCFKTEKFPIELKEKLCDIRLEIFLADRTYRLLKSLNSLPKQEKPLKTRKIRGFLAAAFDKKRGKGYLGAALIMLFGAYFSVFSLYYIAVAAVCFTLALLCKTDIAQRVKSFKTKKAPPAP